MGFILLSIIFSVGVLSDEGFPAQNEIPRELKLSLWYKTTR